MTAMQTVMQNMAFKIFSSERVVNVSVRGISCCSYRIEIYAEHKQFATFSIGEKMHFQFIPEDFNAFNAYGTTPCGAGKSKNTASALPSKSSLNPLAQTSRW